MKRILRPFRVRMRAKWRLRKLMSGITPPGASLVPLATAYKTVKFLLDM